MPRAVPGGVGAPRTQDPGGLAPMRSMARDRRAASPDQAHMTGTGYQEAFTEVFGFAKVHPTFRDAHEASESMQCFRGGPADFWRYKASVGNAFADEAAFAEFQHDTLFHFCTSRHIGQDHDALAAARARDGRLLDELLAIGDSPVGYRPGTLPPGRSTVFHTRHCAHLTFLLHWLRQLGDPSRMHFVEIGGGFGNLPRLCGTHTGFGSWTICDMPFMSRLQRWYLSRTLPDHPQVHGEYGALDRGTIRCVDTDHRNEFVDVFPGADVLISTHAWSELSDDEFLWYLRNLLPKVRFVLYAAAAENPDVATTRRRIDRLQRELRTVDAYWTHDHSVITALFERRT